jgi:hypothetical protein
VRPEYLRPDESRAAETSTECRPAEWSAEVLPRMDVASSAPAVPFVVVVMPAAPFVIVGGLPPARTAAPAALFVVSHRCYSL